MHKHLSKYIISFVLAFLAMVLVGNYVLAVNENVGKGLDATAKVASLDSTTTVEGVIGIVIGTVLAFVGALFLILMIYGGLTWMLARGNDQEITKAKNIIISAVIGIVVVVASYAITRLVLTTFSLGS